MENQKKIVKGGPVVEVFQAKGGQEEEVCCEK
jgi:hypothetical protein